MISTSNIGSRHLLAALAAALAPGLAHAQAVAVPPSFVQPGPENAGSALSRNLTLLANNPNSIAALTGAGQAALDLDDPQAALTFFGRAEELSPRDGRIKAGIGTAMVMMEQARPALKFFDEAVRLGIAEGEVAGDRGLAYDLSGDPARAQQDYQLALRRRDDAEIRRRLALSLAISGKRDPALAVIDEQLRRQDRAAWRTRAFVLALTGDAAGASRAVEAAMPAQAAAMAPFLAKLPSLSAADRALAVHFGHFPGQAQPVVQPVQSATASTALPPGRTNPVTVAGRPDVSQVPLGAPPAVSRSNPPRVGARLQPTETALARPAPVAALPVATPPAPQPPQIASIVPTSLPASPGFSLQPGDVASAGAPPPVAAAPAEPPPTARSAAAELSGSITPAGAAGQEEIKSLADVSQLIAGLSDPAPRPAAAAAASAGAAPAAPKAVKPADPRKDEKAVPKPPARIWVQLAHGATPAVLPREFAKIKARAPKLLAKRDPWTASQRAMSRLLVGPFKSNKEAQDFINQLDKLKVQAISWTSPAGLEIKKLS